MAVQTRFIEILVMFASNECGDELTPFLIGDSDYRNFGDTRMAEQQVFDVTQPNGWRVQDWARQESESLIQPNG